MPTSIELLLVEDSAIDRRVVNHQLSKISDPIFRVTEAESIEEALGKLCLGLPQIILLDLALPDAQGLGGLASLAQEYPSVPIVILTADEDEDLALQAFRLGAQDYLVKGQTPAILLKRVLLYAIERKRVDIALNQHRENLRTAQRLELMGRVAGKVAHDFNNILNTIMGFADLALEDLEGHPSQEDLREIKSAAQRGAKLTKTVLDFSVRGSTTREACRLDSVVSGIEGILRLLLPTGAQIETELGAGQRLMEADPVRLEEVLKHLVLNARDALRAHGAITVRTGLATVGRDQRPSALEPGEYLTLEVVDNGIGMDHAQQSRMFDPFFTTKAQDGGRGLGLSQVVDFVRGQRGEIRVESQPNIGTRVTLFLPQVKEESVAESGAGFSREKKKVVVLDELLFSQQEFAETFAGRGFSLSRLGIQDVGGFVCDSDVRLLFVESRDFHDEVRVWAHELLSRWPDLQVVVVAAHSDNDALNALGRTDLKILWRPFSPASLNALLRTVSLTKP